MHRVSPESSCSETGAIGMEERIPALGEVGLQDGDVGGAGSMEGVVEGGRGGPGLGRGRAGEAQAQRAQGEVAARQDVGYARVVCEQTFELLRKNSILALRNRVSTTLRLTTPLLFTALVYVVNLGLRNRYRGDSFFRSVPHPEPTTIGAIPRCEHAVGGTCLVFAYSPAFRDGYEPSSDAASISDLLREGIALGECTGCSDADCDPQGVKCASCCEKLRVHMVVRGILRNNRGPDDEGGAGLPASAALGFRNESTLNDFVVRNPQAMVQGTYVFSSPEYGKTTFVVGQNSTLNTVRGEVDRRQLRVTVPMQVAASREIARQLILRDESVDFRVRIAEFAHPAFEVATFEGFIMPLFLLSCLIFPFVMQLADLLADKEFRFRQALTAVGLTDLSYWLSWHVFHTCLSGLQSALLCAFGRAFGFDIFSNNDFAALFLTFFLFLQSMSGLSFLLSAVLSRTSAAVPAGFGVFLLSFAVYFVVDIFRFPFGRLFRLEPYSYEYNTEGSLVRKADVGGLIVEPLFAVFPPTMLVKAVADLGLLADNASGEGVSVAGSHSYCTIEVDCNADFSIRSIWGWFALQWAAFSLAAIYLDNVLPDALGARKPLFYWAWPSYWGLTSSSVLDEPGAGTPGEEEGSEEDEDEDVAAAAAEVKARANMPMGSGTAIELRGIRKTYRKGGADFHAVAGPWYSVGSKRLFALLGPNGAGKTTTISMLTGAVPLSGGNALVLGETVASQAGLARVRKRIGVCPQFDVLWNSLTALEHLCLFAKLKGVRGESVRAEAARRLEEVRLTEVRDSLVESFSGGMKRRLSVAISLVGDPEVVFLDEPTTGMDPINRRHVWDVIEATKQDRCVVLTTHSMEEADALGDTVGIMAKGRLRCIGSAVRLKSRFGAGYKVSVSCGSADGRAELKKAFVDSGGEDRVQVHEAGEYLHFSLHGLSDTEMAGVFGLIDEKQDALGVSDIQIGMSTLEDVFLRIVKKVEVEEARRTKAQVRVELPDGEGVFVNPGDESENVSPKGTRFRVKWGTDEEGALVASDVAVLGLIREDGMGERKAAVQQQEEAQSQPSGAVGEDGLAVQGQVVPAGVDGEAEGAVEGMVRIEPEQMHRLVEGGVVQVSGQAASVPASPLGAGDVGLDLERSRDRSERMGALQSSFGTQAGALLRKNLAFQATRHCTNLLFVISPILALSCVLCLQYVVEELLLSQPRYRCPYCGPKNDTWGKMSCPTELSCPDFFFPEKERAYLLARHGVDVREECLRLERECGGGGALECFLSQYASTRQFPLCPFPTGVKEPSLSYAPSSRAFRSATPVLFTGGNRKVAEELMIGVYPSAAQGSPARAEVSASAAFAAQLLFTLLVANPVMGCAGPDLASLLSRVEEEAVCMLLQSGVATGTERPCCADLSDEESLPLLFAGGYQGGALKRGVHWWSANPLHTDAAMASQVAAAAAGQGVSGGAASAAVARQWVAEGAIFATGVGKRAFLAQANSLPLQDLQIDATILEASINAAQPRFQCAAPQYSAQAAARMREGYGDGGCVNLQEGLAVLANAMNLSHKVHPNPEPNGTVPGCTAEGSCTFFGGMGSQWYTPPGQTWRWAQVCEYWTHVRTSPDDFGTPQGDTARLLQAPCMCKWLLLAKQVGSLLLHPSGPGAGSKMRLPVQRGCREGGVCGDAGGGGLPPVVSVGNIPALTTVTSRWMEANLYTGSVLTVSEDCWGEYAWNCPWRFLPEKLPLEQRLESSEPYQCTGCWRDDGRRTGFYDIVSGSCADMASEVCFARRMANLSGIGVGCYEASSQWVDTRDALDRRIFAGQHDMGHPGPGPDPQEEFLQAFDWGATTRQGLDVTVSFNDTSLLVFGGRSFNPNPRMVRVHEPLRLAMDAFVNWRQGVPPFTYTSAMLGIQEMPKPANIPSLDLGSLVGPFMFTMVMALPIPVIAVSIVYEKEVRLRVLMQMCGLGTAAYFVVNYLFWLAIYVLFLLVFYGCAATFRLPSGYTISIIAANSGSVQALFAFLVINNTIAFAFLFSTIFGKTRTVQLCSTLWVVGLSLLGWACWDVRSGNIFNMESVSVHVKNLITALPLWAQFRAWMEMNEYADKAQRLGLSGMQWSDVPGGSDGRCGMGAVLAFLAVEWPAFLVLAVYLDQVLDSGRGVPRHPLFFLGWGREAAAGGGGGGDAEAGEDGQPPEGEDVKEEAERVSRLLGGGVGLSAVVIVGLRKVFGARGGVKRKVAVRNLTMAVTRGECFGMLGPNGAGKTTTISMLVGFTRPTSGYAVLDGLDIRTSMRRIYSLMGVCPQHDILWESLTASQHLSFYGRLKNVPPGRLGASVRGALRSVSLMGVAGDRVSTFSGGMKRRLSVAISLIGDPLICYLDEPSTGLDPASRRTLWLAVKKARERSTVFLTTHSMEEAEHLCDRLGIFVDGALRCVGSPKHLTRKHGGNYQVTVYCEAGCEEKVSATVLGVAEGARVTYALARTIKYELPCSQITLARLFEAVRDSRGSAGILDWGVSTTTLEEAFIKIARSNGTLM